MEPLKKLVRRCDERVHRVRALAGWPKTGNGKQKNPSVIRSHEWGLIPDRHFAACRDHINYSSMRETVMLLGGKQATIVETGSSAWGTNSTILWDAYVQAVGGQVWTVDIRPTPSRELANVVSPQTTLVCDDSVVFLRQWAKRHRGESVSLVYLDSWDLSFNNPMSAAIHCLNEFLAIESHLRDGALLLIDDTPGSVDWVPAEFREAAHAFYAVHGVLPGKGMLVDLLLQARPGVKKIHHRYQTLYQFG